ncbi:glycoside hydrolase family 125 protein [Paenibacillus guangzhouensis]|uniref:glycoside hydrolase family 125 protein n=1 Tax=Paenibacillus guangzhouensis TaxID=1473112 RepID=UPI001266DB22|nr:glycoside hydrolase family 125 protein [Paenibacillus guangzhouensis]
MYTSIYDRIDMIKKKFSTSQPELVEMFRKCYPNTLETTVELLSDNTTFVITGDIPAMWLRDSSAQVRPYIAASREDEDLQRMIRGLIHRQAQYILLDPYANAFNKEPDGSGHQTDITEMGPHIWERKFELDSLCYPVQLAKDYWEATRDTKLFNDTLHEALCLIVQTMQTEQHHNEKSPYSFERSAEHRVLPSDTIPFRGRGTRTNYTGMIWSGFRPSDDACKFGFLVPANMFAVVVLGHIIEFATEIYLDFELESYARQLRDEIEFGIQTYGIFHHPFHGPIYAYEIDGFGNYNLMDDANVPSLLSIPYLGYRAADDSVYRNTRAFVLSQNNPYYYEGKYARGVGSPHTPEGYVWHIGLIIQGLTSVYQDERDEIIQMLLQTTAETGFMHESFDPQQPKTFTRPWFA